MYDSRNLSEVLSTVETTVAPSTLIPFYDEDSAVLFLTAKVWKYVIKPGVVPEYNFSSPFFQKIYQYRLIHLGGMFTTHG